MPETRGRGSSASCTSSASASNTRSIGCPDRSASAFYIPSLSANTLIYKGMLIADQIIPMFPDLADPDFESALALVHQRFSTNTFPSWPLAHPYRYIAHNGEINTLRGNINWMRAREGLLTSPLLGEDLKKILPIIREGGSDTATFDNVLEFLVMTGRSLPHAILMMIPEPWAGHESMSAELKAFYEYHSSLMEPWDGPASIAFTDGSVIGAVLDRNGLRPSRYYVTKDDLVIMASEVGVLDIPPENILIKERLHPGRIFLIDTVQGRIVSDEEIKKRPGARAAVRGMARGKPGRHRGSAGGAVPAASQPRDRAAAAADLRLHRRGSAAAARADGREGRRSDRLDGQRRVARGALGSPAPAVRLLHAGVRAGHQSAARRHPRAAGDRHGIDDRPGGQPARSASRVVPPDRDQVSGDRQRPAREGAAPLLPRVPIDHAADGVRPARRRPEPRAGDGEPEAPRQRGGRGRLQHPDPVGSRHRPGSWRRSRAFSRRPACTIISSAKAPGRAARWSSNRAMRAKCITARCCSATAPAWSTRTWRSRRSTT